MGVCGGTLLIVILVHWTSLCFSETPCYTDHVVANKALHKTAYGAEPYYHPASYAVDGDRHDLTPYCYVSHAHVTNPWLAVDLGEETPVSTVVMVARGDVYYIYTTNLRVLVGNDFVAASFDPVSWSCEQCGGLYRTLGRGEVMYVQCNRTLLGRYTAVHMDTALHVGAHYLQICELEVYSEQVFHHEAWTCVLPELQRPDSGMNLALGRPAYLSSAPWGVTTPALLVDGNDNPNWYGGSCTYTTAVVNPWFVVDLGTISMVTGVKLINRDDCCYSWMKELTIYVGNNEGPSTPFDSSKYEMCAKMCHQQTMRGRYYSCHTRPLGRHVALMRYANANMILQACEVEVYGPIEEEVSFPSRESGLTKTPSTQWQLYDDDDTTCLDAAEDLLGELGDGHQLSLTLQWYPGQMDSVHDGVAVYRCKEDFYLNVTHGADLRYTIVKGAGSLTEANISGNTVSYQPCPMTWQTEIGGVLRSRFLCRCEDTCHLLLRLKDVDLTPGGDNRLCTIKMYD